MGKRVAYTLVYNRVLNVQCDQCGAHDSAGWYRCDEPLIEVCTSCGREVLDQLVAAYKRKILAIQREKDMMNHESE